MYYYICPYCDPSPKSHLEENKAKDIKCKYNKEKVCAEEHQCKNILKCKQCKSEFRPNAAFIKNQKRKIKDG